MKYFNDDFLGGRNHGTEQAPAYIGRQIVLSGAAPDNVEAMTRAVLMAGYDRADMSGPFVDFVKKTARAVSKKIKNKGININLPSLPNDTAAPAAAPVPAWYTRPEIIAGIAGAGVLAFIILKKKKKAGKK